MDRFGLGAEIKRSECWIGFVWNAWRKQRMLLINNEVFSIRYRAHQNDLENILPYLTVGLFYVLTGPPVLLATILFKIATLARIVHTFVYAVYVIPQPARALSFGIQWAITIFMAGASILYFFWVNKLFINWNWIHNVCIDPRIRDIAFEGFYPNYTNCPGDVWWRWDWNSSLINQPELWDVGLQHFQGRIPAASFTKQIDDFPLIPTEPINLPF